jgi:4-hydroxybenzoate polyprenyltransferase
MGFLSTCAIASANYVINEYLDAEFDKFHPTKKYRSVVENDVKGTVVAILWIILTIVGFVFGYCVNIPFMVTVIFLWLMGVFYNVEPFRTKDIPFLDVLSESINNAIRLLLGWFIISNNTIAPCSILFGYWMSGAFLMATKRYAEYRMINDPELAGRYRKSFKKYTEKSLLLSAFFYAMCSVFFIGIFLIKYKIELLLFMPFFMGLFCYYFYISFKDDSAVQKPEKLYHEKGLMIYLIILCVLFALLMFTDMPWLQLLISTSIIKL